MICPTCRKPMIVFEYRDIELDHCISCRGTWFDEGELELLFSDQVLFSNPLLSLPDASTREAKRRCPICSKKMKKVFIGDIDSVLLDVCRYGDGIWFDAGEVNQMMRQVSDKLTEEAKKTMDFLGGVFQST